MVMLQPDGKAVVQRDQLPDRQRASKLQRELPRELPERVAEIVVSTFKPLDLDLPTVASSNQIVLVGRSTAHVFWDIPNLF